MRLLRGFPLQGYLRGFTQIFIPRSPSNSGYTPGILSQTSPGVPSGIFLLRIPPSETPTGDLSGILPDFFFIYVTRNSFWDCSLNSLKDCFMSSTWDSTGNSFRYYSRILFRIYPAILQVVLFWNLLKDSFRNSFGDFSRNFFRYEISFWVP